MYLLGGDGCTGGVYSTISGAAFLGSKLKGGVVGVVDLVYARCVGRFGAVFPLGVFLSVYLLGGDDFAGSCRFAGGAAAFLRIVPLWSVRVSKSRDLRI